MGDQKRSSRVLEQVRERLREAETTRTPTDPDFARTYAGEWVVIHHGRVVAHEKDGAEVARVANVQKFPGSEILYVPTQEKRAGVRILKSIGSDA